MEITEEEIWKDAVGYEGLYMVSNIGRVKSFYFWRGKDNPEGRLIIGGMNNRGYRMVHLIKNGKAKYYDVHQLVAMSFMGHIPNGFYGLVVDHIDHNKLNNFVGNLQLVSNRENCSKDRKVNGTTSKYIGVHWCKREKRWIAKIRIGKKRIPLGHFKNEDDAGEAYKKALLNIKEYGAIS